MNNNCILLFIKYPQIGKVKSRLARDLGEEITVELYQNFVQDILSSIREIEADLKICFHPPDLRERFVEWLGGDYDYLPQDGQDLGERMAKGLTRVFSEGYDKAIIIGSDSPDLPGDIIEIGLSSLCSNDVVIGPSHDGGYYLIGFDKEGFLSEVFRGIAWSSATVFKMTIDIIGKAGLKVFVLPEWRDVDTLDDLRDLIRRNNSSWFRFSRTFAFLSKYKMPGLCGGGSPPLANGSF